MCKSRKQGGQRCFAGTTKELNEAKLRLKEHFEQIEKQQELLGNAGFYSDVLDNQLADFTITPEEYDRKIQECTNQRRQAIETLRSLHAQTEDLEKDVVTAQRAVYTTTTGLKELKAKIAETADPTEKRNLEIEYNRGRRINAKRYQAFKNWQKNSEKAEEIRKLSREKLEQANQMKVVDGKTQFARQSLMNDSKRLWAEAELAENDGMMEAQALLDIKTGNIVPAKLVSWGDYGAAWGYMDNPDDPNAKITKRMMLPRGKTFASREKFYRDKGLLLGKVLVPGTVVEKDDGKGGKSYVLSRADGGFSPVAPIVEKNAYKEQARRDRKEQSGNHSEH